jgi:nitroreductase
MKEFDLSVHLNKIKEEKVSTLKELVLKNRSVRRFKQNQSVSMETLKELVDLARLSPSAANKQPLKYVISNESDKNKRIFPHLAWAGYLSDWKGPAEGEQPAAYIIICVDKTIAKEDINCDHGIAAQSILLGAVEKGLGGCIIGSINRDVLQTDLNLPDYLKIMLVLALGVPNEQITIEKIDNKHDIKYWRDPNNVHHVPKRILDEIIYITK